MIMIIIIIIIIIITIIIVIIIIPSKISGLIRQATLLNGFAVSNTQSPPFVSLMHLQV